MRILHCIFVLPSVAAYIIHAAIRPSHTQSSTVLRLRIDDILPAISQETILTVLPKQTAIDIIAELRQDKEFFKSNEVILNDLLKSVEKRLRDEPRSIREIIGVSTAEKVVSFVEELDVYDSDTVRAFLQSGIVETMIGEILYEAIFEFLKRADIVGNVVNNMPLIGPIRVQITKELKKALDVVLGPQVKAFLANFNRVAVQRMIDFVLRAENKPSFRRANRNLVDSILSKKVSGILPVEEDVESIRDRAWLALGQLSDADVKKIIDIVYDFVGSRSVGEIVDIPMLMKASPAAKDVAQSILDRYVKE